MSKNDRSLAKKPKSKTEFDIDKILNELVEIRLGGKPKKLHPFEVSVRKMAQRAIKEKNIGFAKQFIELCEGHKIIVPPPEPQRISSTLTMPYSWDYEEWMKMFKEYGPPPWPGKRPGLPDDPPLDKEDNKND